MIDILLKTDLFKGLNKSEITYILDKYTTYTSYTKDELIFHIGDIPKEMYILVNGEVTIFRESMNGEKEFLKTISKSGSLFGEVYLYLNRPSYDFSSIAEKDTRLVSINKSFFSDMFDLPESISKIITKNYINILTQKASYLNTKIRIMSGLNLRSKLSRYLIENEKNGTVKLKLTREELAEYISSTRPSVSRELNKMQKDGLITINPTNIKINKNKLMLYY